MNSPINDVLKLIKHKFSSEEPDQVKLQDKFDDFYLSFSSKGPMKILKETETSVPSYWIVTPNSSHQKVALFFHGGAFNMGSAHGHEDLCQRLSKYTHFSVLSVDYKINPENPFPQAVEDCVDSYLWLIDEGFHPEDVVICGISAGGNLTLSTLLALKKIGIEMPSCAVCMSPAVDFTFPVIYKHLKDVNDWISHQHLEKVRDSYLQGQNPKNPLVSPIYGDLEGFPPLLLQAGSRELLLCDINRFRDHAIQEEVEVNLEVWQGMFHCWQMFYSHLTEADASMRSIGEFVKGINKV